MRLEHEVEGLEHRPFYVPVEVVGLEIERVGVREQAREAVRDFLPVLVADADVDLLRFAHDLLPLN